MPLPTVQLSGLCKRFGAVEAVSDVSFDVYPGEIFGLLGPNGAGKTTTIRMMLDIFRPDCGEVRLFGKKLDEAAKNRIGYMPEERGLYRDLKLEPTLVYLATLKGMSEPAARVQLTDWLKRLDLYEHRQKKTQDLSRGMQQKAQLIATLLHNPDLIVVDEPFANLDPVNTRVALEILEEQRVAGKAIIMSTHLMHQVEAMCNRIALIDKGRTVLYGAVDKIKRDFATEAILVEGQGDFQGLPGVHDVRQENSHWRLSLSPGAEPQTVFRALAGREGVKIERFELAEPSLDDIFVAVVQRPAGQPAAPVTSVDRPEPFGQAREAGDG